MTSLLQRALYVSRMSTFSPTSLQTAISPVKKSSDIITNALDALSNGKFLPDYQEDGKKRTVVTSDDVISALKRGFSLRNVEGRFFLTRGLMGGAPPEFSSTQELADHLKNSPEDTSAEMVALKVIDSFAQLTLKTEPLITEATALAYARNDKVTKALVTALLKEIEISLQYPSAILTALFASLRTTLINSKVDALDPDELIKIVQAFKEHIEHIHRQPKTDSKVSAALSTLCDILDVMVDAKVINVKRDTLHKPLYDFLNNINNYVAGFLGNLFDNEDPYISAQAAYAKQALVRTPDDEPLYKAIFRHAVDFGKGCVSLYAVYEKKDWSKLVEAAEHFKNALDFNELEQDWYIEIRFLRLFHEKQCYEAVQKILDIPVRNPKKPQVVNNILLILHEVLHFSSNEKDRKWAMDRMADIFLNDAKWGKSETSKKRILAELKACADSKDAALSRYAEGVLASIAEKSTTKLQTELIKNLNAIEPVPGFPAPNKRTESVELISKADPLGSKILKLKREALNNQDVLNELDAYEPVLASRCIFDPAENTFDLDQDIEKFLGGDKKVFLLLGDSGSGKSTYLRFLENRLWKKWDHTKPMPIFISLSSLKVPFSQVIKEALREKGFTDQEQEELRSKYSFLFLMDGYDELKEKNNLYEGNLLGQWKAKTIITCRTQHLEGERTTYQGYFSPAAKNSMSEASISPFTIQQIENYYKKCVAQKRSQKPWEEFKKDIAFIPDLDSIIKTPLLLRIIFEVLPTILEKHHRSKREERFEALWLEIFDEFISQWFNKAEERLLLQENGAKNIKWKEEFASFAKKLAREMVREGTTSVYYKESLDHKSKSKWEEFFSSDPTKTLIRSGVPIHKIGPNTYAFIHKSLLEFFYARAVIDSSFDDIEAKILTGEPEIIRLLAENVLMDPSQINKLFSIIEHSKSNEKMAIAAANAITILNAAQVNLMHKNFRGVRIPGADLSCSNLTCTDFSHADLRGVKLHGATLDYSTIAFSKTAELELGQKPWIQFGTDAYGCTISSDGKLALSYGRDNAIHLWDCQSCRELCCFRGHTDAISSVAISSDGKFVLSGSKDNTVRLWSCESGQEVRSYTGHTRPITCVAFSPDGRLILSGSRDKTVRVWDINSQSEVYCFTGHTDSIDCAVFSPDSTKVLSGGEDKFVRLWDCKTGQIHFKEYLSGSLGIRAAFTSSGNKALFLSGGSGAYYWDLQSKQKELDFGRYNNPVECMSITPDGRSILIAEGEKVHLWNCEAGKEDYCFEHPYPYGSQKHTRVLDIAVSSDSKWALSGDANGVVCLWDCNTGKNLYTFEGHTGSIKGVAFSSDGKSVLSSSLDGTIRRWDINTAAIFKTKSMISSKLSNRYKQVDKHISISTDGKWIISSDVTGHTISILDSSTGEERYKFVGLESKEKNITGRSSDDRFILSTHDDGTIRISESSSKKELLHLREQTYQIVNAPRLLGYYMKNFEPFKIHNLATSPDGVWGIRWDQDTLTSGRFKRIQLESRINEADFLQDGKSIVVSTNQGSVQLWKIFDEADHVQPSLRWSANNPQFALSVNTAFSAHNLNIQGVNGLSDDNRKIILQHSA